MDQIVAASGSVTGVLESEDEETFEIGLVLAGGGSAGAYIGGVVDFLIEALSEWERARDDRQPLGIPQTHRVRLRVVSGASAGAITTGITARTLCSEHRPARLPREPRVGENRLYDCWVRLIDARELLGERDFAISEADPNGAEDAADRGRLLSLLDATGLERIAQYAIDARPAPLPSFVPPDGLRVHMTVTNLRGVPYGLPFEGAGVPVTFAMSRHAEFVSFALVPPDRRAPAGYAPIDPLANGGDPAWRRLAATAVASGAFPVGLSARLLTRDPEELRHREPRPLWFEDGQDLPPNPFRYVCVDGGVTDNEPITLARDEINRDRVRLTRDRDTGGALLMVEPFPKNPPAPNAPYAVTRRWMPVVSSLVAAVLNQLRFKGEELRAAADPTRFDQFMISPSYRDSAQKIERTDSAIAGEMLGAFGGFLDEGLRRHDFQLGRRNCQAFLRRHFRLPIDAPVFGWQRLHQAEPDRAEEMRQAYAITDEGGRIVVGGEHPSGYFPIIPLFGSAKDDVPLPDRSGVTPDFDDLGARLWNRLRRVSNALIEQDASKYFGGWAARWIAKIFTRCVLIPRIVRDVKHKVDEAVRGFKGDGSAAATEPAKDEWPLVFLFLAGVVVFLWACAILGDPFPKLTLRGLDPLLCPDRLLAPHGLGEFGCADTAKGAATLLQVWQSDQNRHRWFLIVDYGLIVSYVGFLAMVAWSARDVLRLARRNTLAGIAVLAGAVGLAAGLCDATENGLRLWMIAQGAAGVQAHGDAIPEAASIATTWKLRLLVGSAVALAVLWGLVAFLPARPRSRPSLLDAQEDRTVGRH